MVDENEAPEAADEAAPAAVDTPAAAARYMALRDRILAVNAIARAASQIVERLDTDGAADMPIASKEAFADRVWTALCDEVTRVRP